MKNAIFYLSVTLLFSIPVYSQTGVSPNPVADGEIRDPTSIRMRSLQMERMKRDANRARIPKTSDELSFKFNEIKDEFESIQKLQASIIKAYTTGKFVDHTKISQFANELSKKAGKLNENLFIANPDYIEKVVEKKEEKSKPVRDLIIELDKSIGNFVNSPIFSDKKLVDSKLSEKAGNDLERIIKLSEMLSKEAKRFI